MAKGEITRLHPHHPEWATKGITHCDDCDQCATTCTAHEVGLYGQRCMYCWYAPCACHIIENRRQERRYGDE